MVGPTTPLVVLKLVPRFVVYFTESAKYASSAVTRFRRSDFIEARYAFSYVLANLGIAMAAKMPMITTTIIGILAAIAIPKFANTKEKAYLASMKSDLRNLVTAEEAYFADSVKYSSTIGAGGVTFSQSTGNTLPTINTTADGWTANIKNVNTTKTCSIFIGSTSLTPAGKEGEPKCQ